MSNSRPYFQTAFKFGLMGGILIALLFAIMVYFDINPLVANKSLDFGFIIVPIFVIFAIKEFRDYRYGGKIKFWQAMILGMLTVSFIALLSAIVVWSFLSLLGDDFLRQYIADRTLLLEEYKPMIIENTSDDVYNNTFDELQNVTPIILAFDDFLKKIFTGLFITLIISVVLRR
ncbi:MAG: DUF4199 domain-containing protein [Bacteroidota bacterium]|nr:DUF4199 domain-containing protein [Bacteroidota bacterium]